MNLADLCFGSFIGFLSLVWRVGFKFILCGSSLGGCESCIEINSFLGRLREFVFCVNLELYHRVPHRNSGLIWFVWRVGGGWSEVVELFCG